MIMEFKVLTEILDDLTEVTDINGKTFKPTFDYGTQADLLKILSLKQKGSKTNTYPLVWLLTPFAAPIEDTVLTADISLIIATISDRNISNRQRTRESFIQILNPMLKDIQTKINHHPAARVNDDGTSQTKYFNYENDLEKGATEIWDAIMYEATIEINLNCIN